MESAIRLGYGIGSMWYSLWKSREKATVCLLLVVAVLGITVWDWHTSVWDWLGEDNGSETNSVTFRNFSIIPLSVLAIYLTLKRIKIAERQARTSEGSLGSAREAVDQSYKTLSYTQHKDRNELLHNQYNKALEMLNHPNISARLGAIYELQRIHHEDAGRFHIQTMKVLSSFLRFPYRDDRIETRNEDDPLEWTLREDVQASMEVIAGRTEEHNTIEKDAEYNIDLRRCYLVNLELHEANLTRINMRYSKIWGAYLVNCDFSNSVLERSEFTSPWAINQREQGTINARSSLDEIREHVESQTVLMNVKFIGSELPNANFRGAEMHNVQLTGAELHGADLSMTTMRDIEFKGANLHSVNLSGANLSGYSGEGSTKLPSRNLTQDQLNQACADPENPPLLDDDSGLVWNGGPC